jgi:hypothetical protein
MLLLVGRYEGEEMKIKLITRFLMFSITLLLFIGASFTHAQPNLSSQGLRVSKYGTLLEIFDANGQSRFGKLSGDGFQISYQFKGKTVSASAVGEDGTELVAGTVNTGEQTATAITTTSDQALEITTYFRLNEKTKKLIIQRNFKNISKEHVVVLSVQEYLSPALVITGQLSSEPVSDKLVGLIKGQLAPTINLGDCKPGECPKTPPPCPIPCPTKIEYDVAQMTIRTNPADNKPETIILPWNGNISMGPAVRGTKAPQTGVSAVSYVDVPL